MQFTDQTGYSIELATMPKRIISLVPSQTELLFDLGAEKKIVGLTKFCIHPKDKTRTVTKIGGTKNCHIDRIRNLQADLIIGNKEENTKDTIIQLRKEFPVWISDIQTLTDVYGMMEQIGLLTERENAVDKLIVQLKQGFTQIPQANKQKIAYLIWRKPYMAVGQQTFIHEMLTQACGYRNIFADCVRYPVTTLEEIKKRKPDVIFLSSEPYPFAQQHLNEINHYLPEIPIQLVDGEMFSWYGSRLLKSISYFSQLNDIVNSIR